MLTSTMGGKRQRAWKLLPDICKKVLAKTAQHYKL